MTAADDPASGPASGPSFVPAVRDWHAPFPIDVRLTLCVHRRGGGDPAYRVDAAGAVWRTSLTPEGPATLRVLPARGGIIMSTAWGPGADWLLDTLPDMLGGRDERAGFRPGHSLVRELAARHAGLRIGRSHRAMEALVPAVLEQKVLGLEAHRAWRTLMYRYGTLAPGPAPRGMRVFPPARFWARIPSWEWHRAGVEGVRAETIIRAASVADSLERLLTLSHEEADRKLRTIPGIGVWTSAEARQRAAGDPDAVSVGDYHLKNVVGWALAGRDRSTDEEMLALLEPFKGHRHRATRLIGLSRGTRATRAAGSGVGIARYGTGGPPRRGPRMSIRDYRGF
jgi:hypothetical protein